MTFEVVREIGLTLADVEADTRYDGSPRLKIAGCFMAGLATHESATRNLVVKWMSRAREWLPARPDIYYVTETAGIRAGATVRLDRDAVQDLLSMSRWLVLAKATSSRRYRPSSGRGRRQPILLAGRR
jgi:hypothetical protein